MEVCLDMNYFHFLGLKSNAAHSNLKQIVMYIQIRTKSLLQITYELDGFLALIGSSFEVENDEILFVGLEYKIKYEWYH